jgi:hypothetical protein
MSALKTASLVPLWLIEEHVISCLGALTFGFLLLTA